MKVLEAIDKINKFCEGKKFNAHNGVISNFGRPEKIFHSVYDFNYGKREVKASIDNNNPNVVVLVLDTSIIGLDMTNRTIVEEKDDLFIVMDKSNDGARLAIKLERTA